MNTEDDQSKQAQSGETAPAASDADQTPIDCETALQQVFRFIDRELSDEERSAMDQHLHTCQSCFSRVEFERLLKDKVSDLRSDQAEPHLASRIKNLIRDF